MKNTSKISEKFGLAAYYSLMCVSPIESGIFWYFNVARRRRIVCDKWRWLAREEGPKLHFPLAGEWVRLSQANKNAY